jgi:hypothetical protein
MLSKVRCITTSALCLAAILAIPAQLLAAPAFHLEATHPIVQIAACDTLVDVNTGETFHVEKVDTLSAGKPISLSGSTYTVTGVSPAYHLEDGKILVASGGGSATLQGQQWTELYPDSGRVLTSSGWSDNNRNGAVSPGDTLTFDGRQVRVTDVRLHIDVVPAVRP